MRVLPKTPMITTPRKSFEVLDVASLKAQTRPTQNFVISPIVPIPGITILHGRWGTGKTAVLVTEAVCVASGRDFIGLPTTQGNVLIIEADMPFKGFLDRFWGVIQRLDPTAPIKYLFTRSFDALNPMFHLDGLGAELIKLNEEFTPKLVIVDALRRTHLRDEREGSTSNEVYDYWMRTFPDSAVQIIAHDRKFSGIKGGTTPGEEAFSGHQGWLNDAQSALHISPTGEKLLVIEHTKSQVAELTTRLDVRLNETSDWIKPSSDLEERTVKRVLAEQAALGVTNKRQLDEAIGKAFNPPRSYRWGQDRRIGWEQKQAKLATGKP